MRALPRLLSLAALALFVAPAQAETSFPLTLDNCGMELVLPAAPQRVVAIKSTATEMLLALGLGERIIGVGFQDGSAPEPWTLEAATLPVLSDRLPSQEVVLEVEPDFIYGGWESNFGAEGVGERQTLARLGITGYVAPAACRSIKPDKLTFEDVFADVAEMGMLMDVAGAAARLIEEQRSQLAGIEPDPRGLTAVWYSSGTKTPYVGAGSGAPQMMMEALGLQNVMADVDEHWVSASWEAVLDADPDVIVLVDAAWNSVDQKKTLLEENALTRHLDAVVHQRYLTIPFPASEAGVRNVGATADMVAQLAALEFGP
ncbi:MAG TPA: putative F420-0 ABC transporter substrate-binding protein [Devosia sp.]|nr:putative F420-0 ABC transporter substrate-binding protein [Devosia sp.]